ncbi:MAG: transcriptional repressor LexA [Gammaproteobacteria bacterium]|nr:MAG: transcriptional repressor LexA [Gammaproteobacteria bacterium]
MLTPTQRRLLDFLERYWALHGQAPTLAEMGEALGIRSRGTVHRHVQALVAAGHLRRIPGRKRGLALVRGLEHPALPLLGRIAAGRPIEAIPDEDRLDLAEFLLGPGRFALRVQGDSMVGAGILDGDTVVVESCEDAPDGAIVVALIDNEEATLKRLRHRPDGTLMLIPENPDLRPLIYPAHRVRIQGRVVGVLRSYG